jgi:malonyl-CoA/methylmalonyl-CoA synthetase
MLEHFLDRCNTAPDAPFLILPDGTEISYCAAARRTAQLANAFAELGVKPGDRVAVQVDKSPEALLTWLAALQAGAVYLPLNNTYTASEVAYFLSDARPALMLCRPEDAPEMSAIMASHGGGRVATLDASGAGSLIELADRQPVEAAIVPRKADDLAAILYTSGTTGRSKGAMLTLGNLVSNAEVLREFWRFSDRDRLLHALPIYHTHGLFVATNTTIAAGAAMILLPRFSAAELVRWLPQATVMMGVPTFYSRLLDEPGFDRGLASHMRLFVSGSAPLSAETHREFSARTGHAILERYGMTETNMNTSNPYDGARVPGSVGPPLPGVALRIADPETGRELPQGEIGVIEVKGPNVFSGYWNMPEKTAEEFRSDGFFVTGDLGYLDLNGYVFISGRAKDLIISGGLNIYPAEVENELDALPGVAESAVIGVPHPDLGEAVVAVLQVRDSSLDAATIASTLSGKLAKFKQPRRVVFVPELPRNAMGKVQKAVLRSDYRDLFGVS